MFVRVKTTPNSPRRSVQLVEGVRDGARVRQRIVRHIGIAEDDDELEHLKRLGEDVKAKLEESRHQPMLFAPEQLAARVVLAGREGDGRTKLPVDFSQLVEEQRLITGVHEVYGEMYRLLGLDRLLPRAQHGVSHDVLFQVVMARIANPDSRRGSGRRLEEDFGVRLSPDEVCRMMDRLGPETVGCLHTRVGAASRALLPDPIPVLSFACTSLAFGTTAEDAPLQPGSGKDDQHRDSRVLLALAVSREGLPIGCEVFPGATREGQNLHPALRDLQQRHPVANMACVADRGMLSVDDLAAMDAAGDGYVVGTRLCQLPTALQRQLLDPDAYGPLADTQDRRVGEWSHNGRRLIVVWCPKRARKDAHDRTRAVKRALARLARSPDPEELPSDHGARRFLAVLGDARVVVDQDKVAAAARWDGFTGVVTNLPDAPAAEVLAHYRGLRQVEESFRITRHDLRVRPIRHWTSDRIHAHIAIAFMAFACVRHLACRVAARNPRHRMSPEAIRSALVHRQCSVLRCRKSGKRYVIPSKPSQAAERIYATMDLPLTTTPYQLD